MSPRARRLVILGILAFVVGGVAVGFVHSWIQAGRDRSAARACARTARPPGGVSSFVESRKEGGRVCVWADRNGKTIQSKPLP